jgi:DNA-binding MarR family transcriptional regulator
MEVSMTVDVVRRWGIISLGSRLVRIGERLRAHTQDLMDAHDLPIQVHHFPLLTALRENGTLPITDLAANLGVSQPGVTRSVNRLSEQGFVRVEQGEKDKRVRLVSITDDGARLVDYAASNLWPQIERRLTNLLGGESGHLLSILDILEDGISERQLFIEPEKKKNG